jgi:hypothetical protein
MSVFYSDSGPPSREELRLHKERKPLEWPTGACQWGPSDGEVSWRGEERRRERERYVCVR